MSWSINERVLLVACGMHNEFTNIRKLGCSLFRIFKKMCCEKGFR